MPGLHNLHAVLLSNFVSDIVSPMTDKGIKLKTQDSTSAIGTFSRALINMLESVHKVFRFL